MAIKLQKPSHFTRSEKQARIEAALHKRNAAMATIQDAADAMALATLSLYFADETKLRGALRIWPGKRAGMIEVHLDVATGRPMGGVGSVVVASISLPQFLVFAGDHFGGTEKYIKDIGRWRRQLLAAVAQIDKDIERLKKKQSAAKEGTHSISEEPTDSP